MAVFRWTTRYYSSEATDLNELFATYETQLSSESEAAGLVQHLGDRGENREAILRLFLEKHLPERYGVLKGEVITRAGLRSPSMDILIYDKINSPVLYVGDTKVLPIEGVFGAIEVKSKLTKAEFGDAVDRIKKFKDLAPRDLSVIQTREYTTVHRPARPFGIVFGFDLGDNSLESLQANWADLNRKIHWVNNFVNLTAILGVGIIYHERVDFGAGEKHPLLDTDEFVSLVEIQDKRQRNNEPPLDVTVRAVREALGQRTLGRFFVLTLVMLERLKLGVADLGQYLDPTIPLVVRRES